MKGTKKRSVAVVGGAGVWGAKYLHAYANRPDCEVIALVDTAESRSREFADHYGIRRVYRTIDELLADDKPDIVTASVPVSVAPEVIASCAQAGVGVVSCEKPIANTLRKADEMVSVCSERGVPFGCGTAMWEVEHLQDVCEWIRDGNIGDIVSAAIPTGLVGQVSGTGCVPLNFLRFATGMEVTWVEGWTDPAEAAESTDDCSAYGILGLSGGITCRVFSPTEVPAVRGSIVTVFGSNGQAWIGGGRAVLVQGVGDRAVPVRPDFMGRYYDARPRWGVFHERIDSLVRACDTLADPPASGYDYRQVLEIAVALKLSARQQHKRVSLPLASRDHVLNPLPWRLLGGDVAGWEGAGQIPAIVDGV